MRKINLVSLILWLDLTFLFLLTVFISYANAEKYVIHSQSMREGQYEILYSITGDA